MRSGLIVFIITALLVYLVGNLYIYRIGRWIFDLPRARLVYTGVFIVLSGSFVFGRLFERVSHDNIFVIAAVWIGSYWIACMLYFAMGAFLVDVMSVLIRISGRISTVNFNPVSLRFYGGIAIWSVSIILIIAGSINASCRKTQLIDVTAAISKPLTVVAVTDVHLGTIIGKSDLGRLVKRINMLNPDIVIIGGDLFDEDLDTVFNQNMGELFCTINASIGIYAVVGNHEYIGGVDRAVSYMKQNGIHVLKDDAVVAGPIILAGRDDVSGSRMTGVKRKTLSEILAPIKEKLPVFVIDHEPVALAESAAINAFFHLSGHTHHGQMWPLGFITQKIFELSRGHLVKGATYCFTSTGYGTWGPPVRLGNRPEIIKIVIQPK